MKIKLIRSFSKKIQLRQYEPIEFFASAEVELEVENKPPHESKEMAILSKSIDEFVQAEVQKSANKFAKIDTKKARDTGLDDFVSDLD